MTYTEFIAKIDTRGSITIPKPIRAIGFKTGIVVRVKLEIMAQPSKEGQENKQEVGC